MEAMTRNEALEERNAKLELRNREIMLLGNMGERLQACANEAEAQRILIRFARDLCPALSGALSMARTSRNLAARTVSWGDANWGRDKMPATGGFVCIPVMANGEMLGALHLARLDGADLDPSQLRMAAIIAERMALAVANIRLREELKEQSIRDPLTGLFNRRFMEESLDRELQRANRDQSTMGAIMLDIDHFKLFNDTFGHDGGDAVLKEFGAVLEAGTRAEDIVCRYGGEEFLILLPGASLEDTRRRAGTLLTSIRIMAVVSRGRRLGPVSASMGVAVYPQHGAGMASLIAAADDALYQAKTRGRDRFMLAAGHPIHSGAALEAVPSPA
jgi:diguanylate cyclase (GGDEF)-like protein